jgi:cytochrome c-type biogenesis protein CcmH
MTQGGSRTLRWTRAALVLACTVLAGAVGWTVFGPADDGIESASAAAPAEDPITALEALTRQRPDDGEAWARLAVARFDNGNFAEAVASFSRAIDLNPNAAILWSSRGEARIMASARDPMPAAAVADFERAIALDPGDPRARYFLAVRRDLSGDHAGAIDDWLALLADTPPGAVWEADLRRTIEQVGKINGLPVVNRLAAVDQPEPSPQLKRPGLPGPSAEDVRRASALSASQQREMAEGMVARLEARLQGDPANVEGWVMLMRSHVNLGRPDRAAQALAQAVASNPAGAAHLRAQAGQLGIRDGRTAP